MQVATTFLVLYSLIVLCNSYEIQSYENSEAELLLKRITRSAARKRYCYCPINGQGRKKCYSHEKLKDDPNFKLCPHKTRSSHNKNSMPSGKSPAKPQTPAIKRVRSKSHKNEAHIDKHRRKSAGPIPSVKPSRFRRKQKKIHRKASTNHNEMMQSDSPVAAAAQPASSIIKSKKHREPRKRIYRKRKQEKDAPAAPTSVGHSQNDAPAAPTSARHRQNDAPSSPLAKSQIRSGAANTAPRSMRYKKKIVKIRKKSQPAITSSNLRNQNQQDAKQNAKKSPKKKRTRKTKNISDSMVNDQPYSEYSTEYCREPSKNLCLNIHTMNNENGEQACLDEKSAGKTVYDCEKLKSLLSKGIGEIPKLKEIPAKHKTVKIRKRKLRRKRPTEAQTTTTSTKSPVRHKMQRDNANSEDKPDESGLTEKQRRDAEFAREEQEIANVTNQKNDKRFKGTKQKGDSVDLVCSRYVKDMPEQKCFMLKDITTKIFTTKIEKLVAHFDWGKAWNTASRYLEHASKRPQDIEMISRKLDKVRDMVDRMGINENTIVMIGMAATRSPPCQFFAETIPFSDILFEDIMQDCDVLLPKEK